MIRHDFPTNVAIKNNLLEQRRNRWFENNLSSLIFLDVREKKKKRFTTLFAKLILTLFAWVHLYSQITSILFMCRLNKSCQHLFGFWCNNFPLAQRAICFGGCKIEILLNLCHQLVNEKSITSPSSFCCLFFFINFLPPFFSHHSHAHNRQQQQWRSTKIDDDKGQKSYSQFICTLISLLFSSRFSLSFSAPSSPINCVRASNLNLIWVYVYHHQIQI